MKYKWSAFLLFITSFFVLGTWSSPAVTAPIEKNPIWTQWDADHYALIDDGDTVWIGSGSGLIQWNKASQTHTRLSTVEGLPHRKIYSGAVDGAGNRWFGGDAGLSRLDSSGEWTHFNTSNSGIFSDRVQDIAASADETIWLSHGDPSYLSRLNTDGSWAIYPNRQTAVSLEFVSIKETLNQNDLWAASDNEVWIGFDAFDGTNWHSRVPEEACGCPITAAAGSGDKAWVLEGDAVFAWDGQQWSEYPFSYDFTGELFTMTVDKNDNVWTAGINVLDPYSGDEIGYTRLPEEPGSFGLEQIIPAPQPIVAILAADEGIWSIGPNWLYAPDGKVTRFMDAPFFDFVTDFVVDQQGRTWVKSVDINYGTALQLLDDQATATMNDDQWSLMDRVQTITGLEPAPNGDLWVGWEFFAKFRFPGEPTRFHNNEEIHYTPPFKEGFIKDIFAQDERHIFFAYSTEDIFGQGEEKGIWTLDDGGTPAEFSDDIWKKHPIATEGKGGNVAVVDGHLWYGDSSGLYQYQDPTWIKVSSDGVERLVPGAGGELFVDRADNVQVLIIEQDGRQHSSYVEDLVMRDLARIQATIRRNQMWTVAPDGAVWYWKSSYDHQLARRDAQGVEVITTPAYTNYVEVSANNRIWLADGTLWRMSPEPDFQIKLGPPRWFMEANDTQSGLIYIEDIEGYQGAVELSISDLPVGVTAEISPTSLLVGETAVLILTTDNADFGDTTLTVEATSHTHTRQQQLKLAVVDHTDTVLLPLTTK